MIVSIVNRSVPSHPFRLFRFNGKENLLESLGNELGVKIGPDCTRTQRTLAL